MSYWTGLVQGFSDRREAEFLKNYEMEKQNRVFADRVYQHLLQSRDPRLQEMALTALANPIARKKGLAGFLGQVEADPNMAAIVARMNEMVPDESLGGGPSPPVPGSAGMSTNVPVRPGSEPISLPPAPPTGLESLGELEMGPPAPPQLTGLQAPPGGMAPPPESKWKRRGTAIPTAEEIAEMTASAQMQGRVKAVVAQLTAAGASPDEIEDAILGMAGAPRNQRTLSAVTGWGVRLTPGGPVVPVLLDQDQGYVTAGGQALPPGAEMVRMSGAGAAGSLTSTVEDTPETRNQLIALGADPAVIARGTGTGYWRMRQGGDGSILVQPGEYTPPPAFAGTVETFEPGTNIPTRAAIPRTGGPLVPLGDAPGTLPSKTQTDAKALVDIVNRRVAAERRPRVPVRPGAYDLVTQDEARKLGYSFRTYAELVQAAQSTPEVTPREAAGGGSIAERVRNRIQQQQQAAPPPARPPARSTGPGPRQ